MKYQTARQMVHDAHNATLSPDLRDTLLNLSRGTGHDNDHKLWHEVMAGKVQDALERHVQRGNPHLKDWAIFCFAPDSIGTIEQHNRIENMLWAQFKATDRYRATDSINQMILCRLAVNQQVHRERNGRERFSQADCYGRLAMSKEDWRRKGWREDWDLLNDLIADWTGWALAPVAQVLEDWKEKTVA